MHYAALGVQRTDDDNCVFCVDFVLVDQIQYLWPNFLTTPSELLLFSRIFCNIFFFHFQHVVVPVTGAVVFVCHVSLLLR